MRLCRFLHKGKPAVGFYADNFIYPLSAIVNSYNDATHQSVSPPESEDLLDFLPPNGRAFEAAKTLASWVERTGNALPDSAKLATEKAELLVPIPRPNKLLLLAGNYAEHIKEGGGMATERAESFPYVFMKPPTTTLIAAGKPVIIPSVSPKYIDYESLELGVVMGRKAKGVSEEQALEYVAGYTVINDISDRKFRPNPQRKERPKDSFFDWQHGKWHDSFCPCGPCVASADAIGDPQKLDMKLRVNGRVRQNATTGQMIFPVAAVIAFLSSFVTLEPGDIISTGTPAGVGNTTGEYLQPGDKVEAEIESIGTLVSSLIAEKQA